MMPKVKFTSNLKRYYPELKEVSSDAQNIKDLLKEIDGIYPGISNYLVDDKGALRKHVNIFIGEEFLKDRKRLSDQVSQDDVVYVMQALSGG